MKDRVNVVETSQKIAKSDPMRPDAGNLRFGRGEMKTYEACEGCKQRTYNMYKGTCTENPPRTSSGRRKNISVANEQGEGLQYILYLSYRSLVSTAPALT